MHLNNARFAGSLCGMLCLASLLVVGGCDPASGDDEAPDGGSWTVPGDGSPDASRSADEDTSSPDDPPADAGERDTSEPARSDAETPGGLVLEPEAPVTFPAIDPGQTFSLTVSLAHTGQGDLTIPSRPSIEGSSAFQLQELETNFPVILPQRNAEIGGRIRVTFEIVYRPGEATNGEAELVVPIEGSETARRFDLRAREGAKCLHVDAPTVDFGGVPYDRAVSRQFEAISCGSEPVQIQSVQLADDGDGQFQLDLGSRDSDDDGELDSPISLDATSESASFGVTYQPSPNTAFARGLVELQTNEPIRSTMTIELRGQGSPGTCPTAELSAKVRDSRATPRSTIEAEPLDDIRLDGTGSSHPMGELETYRWSVLETPSDVTAKLRAPSPNNEGVRTFRALSSGTYKIGLRVTSSRGVVSCNRATATIDVVPEAEVRIELTWTNPEDPDETDDQGSDLDLHFLKMGPGRWFEAPYDIYFQNRGGAGVWDPESPRLDLDDNDGAGPEQIHMDEAQSCQWYAVGVHHYKKMFGTAYATVRVWLDDTLVYEEAHQPLRQEGEFWDVLRIHPSSPKVLTRDAIVPRTPQGTEPPVTDAMRTSGACTRQDLY